MKNTYLIILLSLSIGVSFGQNIAFEQVLPAVSNIANFYDVQNSTIAVADIDNDNDQDVLITGESIIEFAYLYINDGVGNYFQVPTMFTPVKNGSASFSDIDNDGDLDVAITGSNYLLGRISKLYLNNGIGTFTLITGTPFDSVDYSDISFGDIDNDNDQDIIVSGENNAGLCITKLYENNGSGVFSLVTGTPFEGVKKGSLELIDVDNDNDLDLMLTGENNTGQYIAKMYFNNGNGLFTLITASNFTGVSLSSIAFADIDNDNDQDVMISGLNNANIDVCELYINNGNGNFVPSNLTSLTGVHNGTIAFSDIDNDLDQDILITGFDSITECTLLYKNNGIGIFNQVLSPPIVDVGLSSIAFIDVDNDSDQDLVISGKTSNGKISELYINDGSGNYSIAAPPPLIGASDCDAAFADIDNDNDSDLIIVGTQVGFKRKIYTNNGFGVYSIDTGYSTLGNGRASVSFCDIDNDSDQDFIVIGYTTSLHKNNGAGTFNFVPYSPFNGVIPGEVIFVDVDNDNDQDVVIVGKEHVISGIYYLIAKIYKNNGSGAYGYAATNALIAVKNSAVAYADIDGDNDQDLLITGTDGNSQNISKLYKNNGLGSYTLVANTPFVGVKEGAIAFADVDNDNDQDVLITGSTGSIPIAKLYKNNGNGIYTLSLGTPFVGVDNYSNVLFADFDNDNDQDVIISGRNSSNQRTTSLYSNNGTGSYTVVSNLPFVGIEIGSIAIADIDGDSDVDVLISGMSNTGAISHLYRNTTGVTYGYDSIVACNFYTWINGITYTSSNNSATDTLVNSVGLDSIVSLNLTINSNTGMHIITTCDSYMWTDSITYYTSNYIATDTFVNILGCDSIVTLKLTINSSSTSTDTLTACNSYTWTNGITYTTSNNTATDTLINAAGCDSVITLNLTINTADATITTSDPSITANTSGASYQWLDCGSNYAIIPSETGQSFTATANGNYAVEVTENGCTDTSACITISSVSLKENSFLKNVSIFPNPSNGLVNIELGNIKDVTIKVLNSNGQLVYEKEDINTKSYQFELKEAAGVYFIEVYSNEVKKEFKLVIKK